MQLLDDLITALSFIQFIRDVFLIHPFDLIHNKCLLSHAFSISYFLKRPDLTHLNYLSTGVILTGDPYESENT